MGKPFEGFDLSDFWEDYEDAHERYDEPLLTNQAVVEAETQLGYKLPASYISLMKTQNGGVPKKTCFPTSEPTTWATDHVQISGFAGIGNLKPYSLTGTYGSRFMQKEWGYPKDGIIICDTPSAGHETIMLDYRECGPHGEPCVIHVDQECDFEETILAANFETFVRGLVPEQIYVDANATQDQDFEKVREKPFSMPLKKLLDAVGDKTVYPAFRNLCNTLVHEKGSFVCHGDEFSRILYDFILYIGAGDKPLRSVHDYLRLFQQTIISMEDGVLSLDGIAPQFIEEWWGDRATAGKIVETDNGFKLTQDAGLAFRVALCPFEPNRYSEWNH